MQKKLTMHDTLGLQDVVTIGGDLLLLPHGQLDDSLLELDVLGIVGTVRYTGVSYMVVEGGLCEATARVLDLFRLQYVKQLGYLQAPWVVMLDQPYVTPISHHTRYLHSLDVMAIASLIGHNLGLSQRDLNTLRVAGFSHDRGTPAGGDSVKLVDPEAFDEDVNYERLLREKTDPKRWTVLCQKYDIDEALLIQAVLNKGILGQILDIADKLAYVARDIQVCLEVGAYRSREEDSHACAMNLREILVDFPYVCGIWDSVKVVDDNLVFTDPRRLLAFLKARIILARELYYHPHARFGEYLISRILVKKLYVEGKLTRDELLDMMDCELERRLEDAYGELRITQLLSQKTEVASFRTRDEAVEFRKKLEQSGNRFALIENHKQILKPGSHFLVDTEEGPRMLLDAYPASAEELHEMASALPLVHVYYLRHGEAEEFEDLLDSVPQAP